MLNIIDISQIETFQEASGADASQPEEIKIVSITSQSQYPMVLLESIDQVESQVKSAPEKQRKLFGTHIREAKRVIVDWVKEKK